MNASTSFLSFPASTSFLPGRHNYRYYRSLLPFDHRPLSVVSLYLPLPNRNAKRVSFSPPDEIIDSHLRISDGEEEEDDNDEAAYEYEEFQELTWNEEEEELEDAEEGDDREDQDGREGREWSLETKRQRLEKLLLRAREYGEAVVSCEELTSVYHFRIDKFQRLAIEAFLRGSSVVVSAPTSSGKTLIAEVAAASALVRGRRLLYTTPLKALSNQKYREFRDAFGENNVGLLTGDSAINKEAPILIMTTEILRNMLYQSIGTAVGGRLFLVDAIVLDEVHYLSDMSRGTVWEEIVIYCPSEVQLLCLSATVANPEELAGWINQIHGRTELITSTKRPVPLVWHFSMKSSLLPLLNGKGKGMNRKLSMNYLQQSMFGSKIFEDSFLRKHSKKIRKERGQNNVRSMLTESRLTENDVNALRRAQVPQIRDTLRHLRSRNMLPAIWFIFSRRGCDTAVQYLEDCNLLDECEMSEMELAFKKFKFQFPDAVREPSVRGLLRGIAAHHAGCLPLWKSFIEELFQRGLIKVVFATETLAAGINMPARSAIISSLSKRSENRRILLNSNELLQMAGRAGRRGIDKMGHVVLVQTPFEGAEECCKLLFRGLEPLVSQFTASYGMVLNLLGGSRVTHGYKEGDLKAFHAGRTLEEARQLVEKSFGNYVGSNVMLAAQEEYCKVQEEIQLLTLEASSEAVDKKCREQLPDMAYTKIFEMHEELRIQKHTRKQLRQTLELERISSLKPLLEMSRNGLLPYICLQYKGKEAIEHLIPTVYLGKVESFNSVELNDLVDSERSIQQKDLETVENLEGLKSLEGTKPSYHVALGSDNSWYLFTERFIKSIYKTGLPDAPLVDGDALPSTAMRGLLEKHNSEWDKISSSPFGALWCMEGSLETWSWSLNIPVLSSLIVDEEVQGTSLGYRKALERYNDQRSKVKRLKKKIVNSRGYMEYKRIIDMTNITKERIERLKDRSQRLISRIEQIEPSGWKEFVQETESADKPMWPVFHFKGNQLNDGLTCQNRIRDSDQNKDCHDKDVSNVIHEARALDVNTHMIFPLGETASAIRGENELWLAMVLRNKLLVDLKPAQLAAVCGSLVSAGLKVRSWKDNSYIYEASTVVTNVIKCLGEQQSTLLKLQAKHGVQIPCELDIQFAGMVEAWASGLTWREIMMDCAMDDGDLARLLRRTIDLLAQIPKLPDIDHLLQRNAATAAHVMDRPPISELLG